MKETDRNIIDQYVIGNLSGDNLVDFKNRLASDESLQNEVEKRKELVAGLAGIYKENLKKRFEEFEEIQQKEIPTSKQSAKVISMRRVLSIAASVLLLVVLSFLLYQNINNGIDHDQLYASNFDAADVPSLTTGRRSASGAIDSMILLKTAQVWENTRIAYENGSLPEALNLINSIDKQTLSEENLSKYLFLKGILQMGNHDYEAALNSFQMITKSKRGDLSWYKALSKLKLQYSNADLQKAFQDVLDDPLASRKRKDQAKEILKELN